MKTAKYILILIVMFLGSTLFAGCSFGHSYYEFVVKGLEAPSFKDYFISNEYDYPLACGMLCVPEVREVDHGVYTVYLSVYAPEIRRISINSTTASSDETILFSNQHPVSLTLSENDDELFFECITIGEFTDKVYSPYDGAIIELDIALTDEDSGAKSDAQFAISVKGYKSFVCIT